MSPNTVSSVVKILYSITHPIPLLVFPASVSSLIAYQGLQTKSIQERGMTKFKRVIAIYSTEKCLLWGKEVNHVYLGNKHVACEESRKGKMRIMLETVLIYSLALVRCMNLYRILHLLNAACLS